MTTEKKIQSNRRNALKSTGPKTKRGIAHSRINAMTHGLSASAILIPGENPSDFENLHQVFLDSYDPMNASEAELVRQLTMSAWKLRRSDMIESYLFRLGGDARTEPMGDEDIKRSPSDMIGSAFKKMWKDRLVLSDNMEIPSPLYAPIRPEQGGFGVTGSKNTVDRFHAFTQLLRYQGSSERSFYRALQALEHLQEKRAQLEPLVEILPAISNQSADCATK
jgi:hypothetical protein